MTKEELIKTYSYEFENWLSRMQSVPVAEIYHSDTSESYEMDVLHVFKLEDGNYAFVSEQGCSCYSASDADIQVVKTLEEAKELVAKFISNESYVDKRHPQFK